jgi:hypothetical protein
MESGARDITAGKPGSAPGDHLGGYVRDARQKTILKQVQRFVTAF